MKCGNIGIGRFCSIVVFHLAYKEDPPQVVLVAQLWFESTSERLFSWALWNGYEEKKNALFLLYLFYHLFYFCPACAILAESDTSGASLALVTTIVFSFFIVFHFSRIIRELVSIELGKKAHDIPFTEQERDGIKQLPDSCFFSRMFERSLRKILGLRFQIAAAISGHMKAQALVFTTATFREVEEEMSGQNKNMNWNPLLVTTEIPPLIYDRSYGPTCIEGSLNTIYIGYNESDICRESNSGMGYNI
ncbi:hypothetical protein ACJX0J_042502 [Zea mays]